VINLRNFYQKLKNGFNYVKKNVVKVTCAAVLTVTVSVSVCTLTLSTVTNTVYAQSLDLTGVAVDTAPVFSMALIVITGLAAIWAIWKTIGLIRAR
jgi:flagellar biosynthesis protein FlhB